jgi:rare lipoprotein A
MVIDPQTQRSCVVRVNDRGPFVKGRIIDLSKAAAACLGILKAGHKRVQLVELAQNVP